MEVHSDLMESLSVTVKISHGEALQVTVNDLVSKYKSTVERKDKKHINAFKTVLMYYLSEEEFKTILD